MSDLAVVDDRTAWLTARRGTLGASDIPGVLGISSYESPWSIWAAKVGLLPLEGEQSIEMEAGHWLELAIAPWFEHRTGLHVLGEQTWCRHPDHSWRSCTPDGWVSESPATPLSEVEALLQIKTRGFGKPWEDVPADIKAQELWAQHVTGTERSHVAVLMGRRLDLHVVERDEAEIAFIVERAEKFWTEHVVAGVAPPTDGHDATLRALAAVYPDHVPDKGVELTPSLVATHAAWLAAKADKKAAEDREKAAAAELQAALGEAEEGTVDGVRVISWRSQSRSDIDRNRLRTEWPRAAADCATQTTYRVLRPHAPKERAS